MVRKISLLSAGALLFGSSADALGLFVSGGPVVEQYRGWISYKGNAIDLKDNLHVKDQIRYFASVEFKHKISLLIIPLPDIRFEYLRVSSSGEGVVDKSFNFGNISIPYKDYVYTKFRFDQYDFTFYYTPLDVKLASVRWGLGAKFIDFYARIHSRTTGQTESKSVTVPLPYLYLGGKLNLLFLGASLDVKGLKVGTSYFYDASAKVGVEKTFAKVFHSALYIGYRAQRYRVDDVGDVSSDLRMKGPFIALTLGFSF